MHGTRWIGLAFVALHGNLVALARWILTFGLVGGPWFCSALRYSFAVHKERHSWQRRSGASTAKDFGGKNSRGWAKKNIRVVCWHRGSRSHWRLSELCVAGIAWKSDRTTRQRMPRTDQINFSCGSWRFRRGWKRPRTESPRHSEWKRGKELELRSARNVLVEPGNEEQVVDRHAVASGEEEKTSTKENGMKDIHIGKGGSETAHEEQLDKSRKTLRFEQDAPNSSSYSTMHVFLEYPASGEKQDRPEPVFMHNLGLVDDDVQNFALDLLLIEMDGRESRHINEVLEWYREEDAGDLRRSESNWLVERMTCLYSLCWMISERQKKWKSEKSNQNIVANEEFVKNSIDECQKIDPKVVISNENPGRERRCCQGVGQTRKIASMTNDQKERAKAKSFWKHKKRAEHSPFFYADGHLSSQEYGSETKYLKYKGRDVHRGDKVTDDSGPHAVFRNSVRQRHKWRPQKTCGCYCEASRMRRTSSWCRIRLHSKWRTLYHSCNFPKSECPDIWTRLPGLEWPASWSNIEQPVCASWANSERSPTCRINRVLLEIECEKVPKWRCLFVHRGSVPVCVRQKQHLDPVWETLMKYVDLGTLFLDHVHVGCTQRECKPNEGVQERLTSYLNRRQGCKRYLVVVRHGRTHERMRWTMLRLGE